MQWIRTNQLTISILGAVLFAYITPHWGATHGYLHSELWVRIGVIIIFLGQGACLSTQALIKGIRYWPLHVFTQAWIFLGIPLLAITTLQLIGTLMPEGLRLGLFFLAILPTTISSAIILVGNLGGNTAGAIFNTVFANLFGVFVIPMWMLWYQRTGGIPGLDVWLVFQKLVCLLLLPFITGHLLRSLISKWEQPIQKIVKPTNQWIIVFMVYAAFSTSFRDRVWNEVGAFLTVEAFATSAIFLLIVSSLVLLSARFCFKNPENRIAACFVGSQKSLAVGIPYSVTLFASLSSDLDPTMKQSIVILPLLFYHPLQLLLASLMMGCKHQLFGIKSTRS